MPSVRHPSRQAFGDRVRDLRKSAGLTQEQLAEKAGLHRTYVGAIERAKCNLGLDGILRLAHALGVAPGVLLDRLPTDPRAARPH